MIPIAEKNVYGDHHRAETSHVPELVETGRQVRAALQKAGMDMRTFAFWGRQKPAAAVFWDCPKMEDPDLQDCVRHKIPFLLVISENMHLQPNPTYGKLKPLAARVLTYQEDEVDHQHVFWLPYGLDLEAGRRFRGSVPSGGRPFLLGMINSWKKSEIPGDLYAVRNRLAIQAAKILGDRMFLAGFGWDRHLVHPQKWQRSLAKRAPGISRRIFGWPNPAYRGPLPPGEGKLAALARCEFALVPENCSALPGYITEKIFNALFAGCIPIYQGHPAAIRHLPPEIFLPMQIFPTGRQLVAGLGSLSPEKKRRLTEAGEAFLWSEAAAPFSSSQYAEKVVRHLQACLITPGSIQNVTLGT